MPKIKVNKIVKLESCERTYLEQVFSINTEAEFNYIEGLLTDAYKMGLEEKESQRES